jgi:hypothetical protein
MRVTPLRVAVGETKTIGKDRHFLGVYWRSLKFRQDVAELRFWRNYQAKPQAAIEEALGAG